MNTTDSANARPSDATSRERPSGESIDSLQREADLARAAIGQKFEELKASLQTAADPREWAREHPWIAVSVAAAAGFAAALAITAPRSKRPSDRQFSPRDRERAYNDHDGYAPRQDAYPPRPSAGMGGSIVSMLFELAKIFMTSHLVPLFQAWQQGLAEQAAQAARGPQSAEAPPANGPSMGGDNP